MVIGTKSAPLAFTVAMPPSGQLVVVELRAATRREWQAVKLELEREGVPYIDKAVGPYVVSLRFIAPEAYARIQPDYSAP